ncbi:MAG: DUF4476 domain-containing protein [Chitinophagaceae bacterium]|nr:DUF4476 domain-containing protein [Chitinophagaceae bacterium]
MKKIFTLSATLLASILLYAGPNQSKLSVSSAGNSEIRVMVDGSKYRTNNNAVMIGNLKSGYHAVKVYRVTQGRDNNGCNGRPRNNMQLVYSSNIYVKPQYHVDITINRFGKALVDEQLISAGFYDDEDDDWWGNDQPGSYGNQAMDARSFDQLKQTLSKEGFTSTRMSIAKSVIPNNYYTTAQVKELLDLFSFDNSKMELARLAYDYTIDKGNYYILADAFSFSSSKDELMKFIQTKKV